jgi:hypothetical protein
MVRVVAKSLVLKGLVGSVAMALALTGCGISPDNRAVLAATQSYLAAIGGGDGQAACAALTPRAADSLRSGGESCAETITGLGLTAGRVLEVRVWGDYAQVRLSSDTLFLAESSAGWKVSAAGCERRPGQPYDCEVEA